MKFLDKILKVGESKRLKSVQSIVGPVNALEPEIQRLSDDELRAKTGEFQQFLENGGAIDSIMAEAFAVIRETAWRVMGQRHYDVQLMGGAALHWGSVAEMKTGEGKTLVSSLPVYLNALTGRGVHVVTVNEYLASRDAELMGQIHQWHGLTVGLVVPSNSHSADKAAQYECDITYGTNNEFGFDYLRDNMARELESVSQRGHNFAIVDEIDSILIDEARTPLIISGKVKGAADLYNRFADVARRLQRDVDYEVDEEKRTVAISDEGISRVEEMLDIENLYAGIQGDLIHQLNSALKAKELFHKDKDYLVDKDNVKIVDEFTGRVLDGRRWSDGLHQAVEAKEKVKIKEEQQTLATVTLQNYFRMYDKLGGMTGTAIADAAELESTYGLVVIQIPTNRPLIRLDEPDFVYRTEMGKFKAAIDDIEQRTLAGQPVLVGTASVEKSEVLGQLMDKRGIKHEVLNAKAHFREADIVAQAGVSGSVTVATNMAGRGVDIILGGNGEKMAESDTKAEGLELESPEGQEYYEKRLAYWKPVCDEDGDDVRRAGGLYVLATERHESRRIDDQLRGRSGRQGDPGETRFYLSVEDDLMRIFASGAMSWVMDRALPEDVPLESGMVTKSVERAQNTVEQRNAEIRKNVLKYDEVYNQQRKVIYQRRLQILEQGELRDETMRAIGDVAEMLVDKYCRNELDDQWDLPGLENEVSSFWPTEMTLKHLDSFRDLNDLEDELIEDGLVHYEHREETVGREVMRQIERQIMLQLIDQRWRDHLTEMAQLREGINLRAMGQRDPLTEWQHEGFDLFSDMIRSLNVNYVRYIMHVEVVAQKDQATGVVEEQTAKKALTKPAANSAASKPGAKPKASKAQATRPQATKRPVAGSQPSQRATARSGAAGTSASKTSQPVAGRAAAVNPGAQRAPKLGGNGAPPRVVTTEVTETKRDASAGNLGSDPAGSGPEQTAPFVKDEWSKTPRNAPCPCDSGKKYKQCHG